MVPSQVLENYSNLPKTPKEAAAIGSFHYFTGRPCSKGHVSLRVASNAGCYDCIKESQSRFRKTPKGRVVSARSKDVYRGTPAGKAYYRRKSIASKKRIRVATPKWGDKSAVNRFLDGCPEGCHIDHIVPLRGESVCGLHVLENLQYLPAQENIRKSNKVIPITLEANICVLPQCRSYGA